MQKSSNQNFKTQKFLRFQLVLLVENFQITLINTEDQHLI